MRLERFIAVSTLLLASCALFGQMTPDAPVKNFRFPSFGESGYTEWVLQGEKGIYDSEEQIRVEEMALRVYSGDERMAKELTLMSPEATIRLKENRAFSKSNIRIVGENFTISGRGWEWVGRTKEIVVMHETEVEFTQSIGGGFSGAGPSDEAKRTVIRSDRLVLQTTETAYHFEFSGSVRAESGDMNLQSKLLVAFADAPGGSKGKPDLGSGEFESIRQIIAQEEVRINNQGRTVFADRAQFSTREGRVKLTGSPRIEVSGAFLSGAVVRVESGKMEIEGSASEGRAQMILTETGGLGLQGMSALSEETIVLADSILMEERKDDNRFVFENRVEVMSGAVQMLASKMTILSDRVAEETEVDAGDRDRESVQVGSVRRMIAEGGVRIEQSGQIATGEQVIFYPQEERCELTGNPQVTNGEAVIVGHKMELKPNLALVSGHKSEKVVVELPQMPDLGYEAFSVGSDREGVEKKANEGTEAVPTVVRSQRLRMSEEPDRTLFRFEEEVEISATNLEAECERLDVFARKKSGSNRPEESVSQLEVERIEAHGSVKIKQSGRTASASRAFIIPAEGKLVLEDNALVTDNRGRVSGYRMTLLQGQRRAIVEGGVPGQERPSITLPGFTGGRDD